MPKRFLHNNADLLPPIIELLGIGNKSPYINLFVYGH